MSRASWILLLSLSAAAALPGGCPADPSGDTGTISVLATASPTAEPGQKVTLTAQVVADVDPARLSYRWYQVFGRVVELMDAQSLVATFTAPSFGSEELLRFRVDVRVGDGPVSSAEAEVTVRADPNYALNPRPGSGSVGSGGDDDPFPRVRLVTSKGTIVLELDRQRAPITVQNFLRYVDDGFYDGTIFHRVIADFVIQGGGFDTDYDLKETRPPIINESDNGLKNDRGTVAMARTSAPNSATSQFFINLVDNDSLNARDGNPGYAVFGRVMLGMDVVDAIAAVETEQRAGVGTDVPVEQIVIERASRVQALGGGGSGSGSGSTGSGSGGSGGTGSSGGSGDNKPPRTPGSPAGG